MDAFVKVAIYPGSFNPYHKGHSNVIEKALKVFDKVIIAVGRNPAKPTSAGEGLVSVRDQEGYGLRNGCLELVMFDGLLSDYVRKINENERKIHAVIRGLRNGMDFEFEKTQQYWNEDLQIGIPTVYFITKRELSHISSSAYRMIETFTGKSEE